MRFNLIREPEENPTDLLKSYRQQNIIMQKIRVLHTAFDGIKLTNWSDLNRELPDILIGSVCEFGGRLFEATDNIVLTDNDKADGDRFIRLAIVRENPTADSDGDYLIAEIASSDMPRYDYYNRGFYSKVDGVIKYKYLRFTMKYNHTLGGYVQKKYWNINDLELDGIQIKSHSISFGVGKHEFDVPDKVDSLTIHLVSGGGGGAGVHLYGDNIDEMCSTERQDGESGKSSQIIINNKIIVDCAGGNGGVVVKYHRLSNIRKLYPGAGGKVTYNTINSNQIQYVNGQDGLFKSYYNLTNKNGGILIHNTICYGGYGGYGSRYKIASSYGECSEYYEHDGAGGGAGSCAIVTINRNILQGSKKIQIIVGAGGKGAKSNMSEYSFPNAGDGEDGSAVIKYFTKSFLRE